MTQLPHVASGGRSAGAKGRGVTFAVYAAIGTDPRLSRFPATNPAAPIPPIHKQALVRELLRTAAEGVNVSALVDLFDDDTYLVEIPAFKPKAMSIVSAWKQDMSDPHALAGFLRRAHQRFPCDALVLAIDSHGAGFIPDLDLNRITQDSITSWDADSTGRRVRWTLSSERSTFQFEPSAKTHGPSERGVSVPEMSPEPAMRSGPRDGAPDDENPPLGVSTPEMSVHSPVQPFARLPMSTWGYGEALRLAIKAGVPKPAVIAFNNCFNASFELLHTVAPYAGFASAYANYDFFTAGSTYQPVFKRLRLAGSATAEELAKWFVHENGKQLQAKHNHPIIGATVRLSRMKPVADAIDALSIRLIQGLKSANGASVRARIRQAAIDAQHYDTEPGYELKVPDQFVDLASFAAAIKAQFGPGDIDTAAGNLVTAVSGFWQFGDVDWPYMGRDPNLIYDFSDKRLGLNIYFPDPALDGKWDWRSPYYLSGKVDPKKPPAHRHVIPFLADRGPQRPRWVEFIVEYHKETQFLAFFPARAPEFPIFDVKFDPKGDTGGGDGPPGTPGGNPGNPSNPTGGPKKR